MTFNIVSSHKHANRGWTFSVLYLVVVLFCFCFVFRLLSPFVVDMQFQWERPRHACPHNTKRRETVLLNTSIKWQNKEAAAAAPPATNKKSDFINESKRQNNYLEIGFAFSFEVFTFAFGYLFIRDITWMHISAMYIFTDWYVDYYMWYVWMSDKNLRQQF